MHQQPSHNSLWFLIARSLSGEASLQEEETLQDILHQDISLQQQYDLLKRMWVTENNSEHTIDDHEKENISLILYLATSGSELAPVKQNRRKKVFIYRAGIAAAAAAVIYAGWIFTHRTNSIPTQNNAQTQTLVAENGSRTKTILPDGSSVWLNAGSHISYEKNFAGTTREVKLDGEAYFDVVKDPKHPFIVHVADYDIKVLGTAFNVKSYATDKTVETTLLRGLVQVTQHNAKKQVPIYLHPNEKLIVQKFAANEEIKLPDIKQPVTKKEYTIKPIDSTIKEADRMETAWVYNRLEFNGDNFEELAAKLERWYNVSIIFDDNEVKNLHLHGSFENESIDEALAALKIATPFNYAIRGREIHIQNETKKQ